MKIMISMLRWFVYVGIFAGLVACDQAQDGAGTGSRDTRDGAAAVYSLFPEGYFTPGYSESYAITGGDDSGNSYVGSFGIVTGNEAVFDGMTAVPVVTTLTYSKDNGGVLTLPITIELTEYYSLSSGYRRIGSENAHSSVVMTSAGVLGEIPMEVVDGDAGIFGNYTGTDGSKETISWLVTEIAPGQYQVGLMLLQTDSADNTLSSELQVFTTDSSGGRVSWEFSATVPSLGKSFTFSGVRQ